MIRVYIRVLLFYIYLLYGYNLFTISGLERMTRGVCVGRRSKYCRAVQSLVL